MQRNRSLRGIAVLVAAISLAPASAAAEAGGAAAPLLEGRWRLVEQRYAGGAANLAVPDSPVRLEFVAAKEGISGFILAGAGEGAAQGWPAFANDEGPLPVAVLERSFDSGKGAVRARYTVRPAPTDDLVLEIEETYQVSDDGSTLAGDMTVRFRQGSEDRGSYTLHRRFERER